MKEGSNSDNRTNILQCALTLFAQRGYDAVGVREIVEMAGITKPTLYHYFTNKQGLLHTLIQERFSPFLIQLEQITTYTGDLPASLQHVVAAHFQFARQEPIFYQMLIALETAPAQSEAYQVAVPFLMQRRQRMEGLFEQAVKDHGNMRGRKSLYTIGLLSLIEAVIRQSRVDAVEPTDQMVWQIVQQFSYGIYS